MKSYHLTKVAIISLLAILSVVLPNNLVSAEANATAVGATCGVERGMDVVFTIDSSGSMEANDPDRLRVKAAKAMVDQMQSLDRFGVVEYSSTASNLLSPLTNNRYRINTALDSIGEYGGTDIHTGLDEAIREINTHSGNNHKIIVLLSDGHSINNALSQNLADEANRNNISIYTIGLGTSATINIALLQDLANRTNGQYYQAINAAQLEGIFGALRRNLEELREPKIPSDWTLTRDYHAPGDLVLQENMTLDLNGYNLTVDGSLVLLSCAELRAVSAEVVVNGGLEQNPDALIRLNNSTLKTSGSFIQNGQIDVNGIYRGNAPELDIRGVFTQDANGKINLNGQHAVLSNEATQKGRIFFGGGVLHAKRSFTQRGHIDLQKGKLIVERNLTIAGGPLIDEAFQLNDSLNVNGGLLQVGSAESMKDFNRKTGNVTQTSGQLYVNHGAVRIFGDYTVEDGWLTMIKGSMDTNTPEYGEGDGDYVHVYRDFTMESLRNHGGRSYTELMKPKDDWPHLTDGVLKVGGKFTQIGDMEFHRFYSDRSQLFTKGYSRYNFHASGRHKVDLTGVLNKKIVAQGVGFTFMNLEVEGRIPEYLGTATGQIKWVKLIEKSPSSEAELVSLSIQDLPVVNFEPRNGNYPMHSISKEHVIGPLRELKVDARAKDRNAKVTIQGNLLGDDDQAIVKVLVTAADGKTTKLYTVPVTAAQESPDLVTSLNLDRTELIFVKEGSTFFPGLATVGYTVKPTTALNQRVYWRSMDSSVATVQNGIVTPKGAGNTTIIAETEEGGFIKTVRISVKQKFEPVQGVKTLKDLLSNEDRYNQIMALYDYRKIGIVVPGNYIENILFEPTGQRNSGTIGINSTAVSQITLEINGQTLPVVLTGANSNNKTYHFSRFHTEPGEFVKVSVYNNAGDLLETAMTTFGIPYTPSGSVAPGYYSIDTLMNNQTLFQAILSEFAPEVLLFEVR